MSRASISKKYCAGFGLEVGAFHSPWPGLQDCNLEHADSRSREALLRWAEVDTNINRADVARIPAKIDYVTPADKLFGVGNSHYDFLVASHVIEHCFDTLATIKRWLEVVKPGGYICVVAPDKRTCSDKPRKLTSLAGLIERTKSEGEKRRELIEDLFFEVFRKVDKLPNKDRVRALAKEMVRRDEDTHFNVWEPHSWEYFWINARIEFRPVNYNLIECYATGTELFAVIRRPEK